MSEVDKFEIGRIVEEVIKKVRQKESFDGGSVSRGVFLNIDDAINAASKAQGDLMNLSLDKRKEIIQSMREAVISNARLLAETAVAETGMGRVPDKIQKNILAAQKTPGVEDLVSTAVSGDRGLTLIEMGPYGVIGAITPSTNPAATVINNSIAMVSAGNSIVFNPHPAAKRVCMKAIELLNEAIEKAGGPKNLIATIKEPTVASSQALMKHRSIRILVVTGGPAVVHHAMTSGKKTIAAGPGNPPVVVDETADIPKAARDIVAGASFDNNVMCISEKEVFVVDKVADELKEQMRLYGAYELNARQTSFSEKLVAKEGGVGCPEPTLNRDLVGKDARVLAKSIGIDVSPETRLLITEVTADHPLVYLEQLMPLLPIVRVKSAMEGIELSVKAEHGFLHTSAMHSKNIENLSNMAYRLQTSIFIKNAPTYAGLGFGGEGHTSLTIAGPTGEGVTSPRSFTRQRRCVLVDYFRII
ncbi:MAG: aldehyde dehydrogenase EutE [Firmicutes bacterium]|nr:aldehyde dehydrogenase EutE [Bacillota bacterium]